MGKCKKLGRYLRVTSTSITYVYCIYHVTNDRWARQRQKGECSSYVVEVVSAEQAYYRLALQRNLALR